MVAAHVERARGEKSISISISIHVVQAITWPVCWWTDMLITYLFFITRTWSKSQKNGWQKKQKLGWNAFCVETLLVFWYYIMGTNFIRLTFFQCIIWNDSTFSWWCKLRLASLAARDKSFQLTKSMIIKLTRNIKHTFGCLYVWNQKSIVSEISGCKFATVVSINVILCYDGMKGDKPRAA